MMTTLPQTCPIIPGNYSITNETINFSLYDPSKTTKENYDESMGIFKDIFRTIAPTFPNGFYKGICKLSTKY